MTADAEPDPRCVRPAIYGDGADAEVIRILEATCSTESRGPVVGVFLRDGALGVPTPSVLSRRLMDPRQQLANPAQSVAYHHVTCLSAASAANPACKMLKTCTAPVAPLRDVPWRVWLSIAEGEETGCSTELKL